MEATQSERPASTQLRHAVVRENSSSLKRTVLRSGSGAGTDKPAAYGLPCAICHLYYPADLDACPTCESKERVAPVARSAAAPAPQGSTETPAGSGLEQEHSLLVSELKSELVTEQAQATDAPAYTCSLEHNHPTGSQPAEVCMACHERLQGRLDVCEAALHMDLKEAAQIVYDAVWADPSDPTKTYRNAASALLAELRKRAAMNGVRGPFHPMAH